LTVTEHTAVKTLSLTDHDLLSFHLSITAVMWW